MKLMLNKVVLLTTVVATLLVAQPGSAQPSIIDLGTLGGVLTFATAISARGQVIGASTITTGAQHAFLWQDGVMTDLGTLGGANVASFPGAINALGQVVGFSGPVGQNGHAFLWQKG